MSTLTKTPKTGLQAIIVKALKPADAVPIPGSRPKKLRYYARYVDGAFKERSLPCTPALFLKISSGSVNGKKRKNTVGLDYKTDTGFIIHAKPGQDEAGQKILTAELIDQYPNKVYVRGVKPANEAERKMLIMEISPGGEYVITSVPCAMRERVITGLLLALDPLAEISEGDSIEGTAFIVHSIAGRRVEFDPQGELDEPEEKSDFVGF